MNMFPYLAALILTVAIWLIIRLLLWSMHRQWWHITSLRQLLWYAPAGGIVFVIMWTLGKWLDVTLLRNMGATLVAIFLVLSVALLISMPFTGAMLSLELLFKWIGRQFTARKTDGGGDGVVQPSVGIKTSRRSFVTVAAGAVPALALTGGTAGLVAASSEVRIPEIILKFPNLPASLIGLRVLHISDVHLNAYTQLSDLEELLRRAKVLRPDLILVTGDLADDVPVLPDALKLLDQMKAPYGTYASMGNHEYYFDLPQVLRSFDKGPIPLLRGAGVSISIGDSVLYVAGADDPVTMKFDDELTRRLVATIDKSMFNAPSDTFTILMSHRPEGFDVARARDIDLTLSGHTHGRQIGFNGRSVFEPFAPERYLWGHYQKGTSQLYTTAGVGHWFPFRLGCPPEAPLYILQRAADVAGV